MLTVGGQEMRFKGARYLTHFVFPNLYFHATAAYAMGRAGIAFIEGLAGCEGYMIGADGIATMTSGFDRYTAP